MSSALAYVERPAEGEPEGLVVLHHGRGTDERDLLGLADLLDPGRRLHVVSPRGPLTISGSPGYHWYQVPRVGHPDPDTFWASVGALAAFHGALWERTGLGPERTVLGGFSQGTVMSWALGLDPDRPAPAGILAFSGFIPAVPGWEPSLRDRTATHAFIAHGRRDPVIEIAFARAAQARLEQAGLPVEYRESGAAHQIDAGDLTAARSWLEGVVSLAGGREQ